MNASFTIPSPRRAQKQSVKLKLALQGPSGSGKTLAALALATNLWPNGRICVVDTENESASLYADRYEFDTIPLSAPYHTERYLACIKAAEQAGYDVLIIDSITHQWDGDGGILRRKEELDQRPGSNSYTNWAAFTPEHNRFKEAIVQAKMNIIATMRSKQDYILETNAKGKQQPRKVGMAAIQREGFDYEFSLVFDIQMDHRALAAKDRTGLFSERLVDLSSAEIAGELRGWLDAGVHAVEKRTAIVSPDTQTPPVSSSVAIQKDFSLAGNRLYCKVLSMELRPKKDRSGDFLMVRVNGKVGDRNTLCCFSSHLIEILSTSVSKDCVFTIKPGDWPVITEVDSIGETEYADGVAIPANEEDPLGITQDDIPF